MELKLPGIVITSNKLKPDGRIGYISTKNELKETFKGEVQDTPITFPKDLGAEHPFTFEDMDKICKSVGIVSSSINKITNSIVGEFSVKTKSKSDELIITEFTKRTKFTSVIRDWIKEGLKKGNGFMELDIDDKGLQVLNANDMYVKRNKKGKVLEYKQWVGNLKIYSSKSSKLKTITPNKIAHLKINPIAGEPYGLGIIWPNERVIENMVLNEQELHKLISRKAGAPIHVAVGREGESVNAEYIDDVKVSLQVMNNRTEWVTDSNVKMNVLDFGDIGKNLTDTLNHDMLMFAYGFEIPIVLMGSGNIPEGLAKVQLESFQRGISAIQEEIESIIEEQIFKPLLESHGSKGEVEFNWNLPGEEEINNRIDRLTKLIECMNTSEPLRRMAEIEIAKLLDLEDAHKYLSEPEKETDEDKAARPGQTPPGQDNDTEPDEPEDEEPDEPEEKHTLEIHNHMSEQDLIQTSKMSLQEFTNLIETNELKYSDYLKNILKKLKIDKFEFLAAYNPSDIADGKLSSAKIESLRDIFEVGFKENKTIVEIRSEIKQLELKDVKLDGKVILKKERRPDIIARTETVRLANLGLIDTYKGVGVKKVEWLAALSERTCDICNALHGQVFDINTVNPPPAHPKCRCSLLSIVK